MYITLIFCKLSGEGKLLDFFRNKNLVYSLSSKDKCSFSLTLYDK
jgi:hypothetical protein